jgi:uncharacterized protein (TIGR03083 family)
VTDRLEITRERALGHTEAAFKQFCSALRAVTNPDATAVGTWTIKDVAGHLRGTLDLYPELLAGRATPLDSPRDITSFNDKVVSAETRSVPELADAIEARLPDFVAATRSAGDEPYAWHGGIKLPVESFCAILISEALVHGHDVTQAEGKEWPIDPAAIRTSFIGLLPLLPYYVDERAATGVRARFELKLRGEEGARAFLFFNDGRLIVEEPPQGRVDCHISADPSAFMLVSYGRSDPIRAALTGKMFAWGRKPWLGFKVPALIKNP